jgi:hypothetical protein
MCRTRYRFVFVYPPEKLGRTGSVITETGKEEDEIRSAEGTGVAVGDEGESPPPVYEDTDDEATEEDEDKGPPSSNEFCGGYVFFSFLTSCFSLTSDFRTTA